MRGYYSGSMQVPCSWGITVLAIITLVINVSGSRVGGDEVLHDVWGAAALHARHSAWFGSSIHHERRRPGDGPALRAEASLVAEADELDVDVKV